MEKDYDDVDYNHLVLNAVHRWPLVAKGIKLQIY